MLSGINFRDNDNNQHQKLSEAGHQSSDISISAQLYTTVHPPVTDLVMLVTIQQKIRWSTASNLEKIMNRNTRNHV